MDPELDQTGDAPATATEPVDVLAAIQLQIDELNDQIMKLSTELEEVRRPSLAPDDVVGRLDLLIKETAAERGARQAQTAALAAEQAEQARTIEELTAANAVLIAENAALAEQQSQPPKAGKEDEGDKGDEQGKGKEGDAEGKGKEGDEDPKNKPDENPPRRRHRFF